MNIEEVSKEQYVNVMRDVRYIYNEASFNELNRFKVDDLKYLLFMSDKYRFGICVGIRNNEVLCPFSAPFGTIVPIKSPTAIKYYDEAIDAFDGFLIQHKFRGVSIILPPMFYSESEITPLVNTLFRKNYMIKNIDLNYQFDLQKVWSENNYIKMLPSNARKNLNIALKADLVIKCCKSMEEIEMAYNIIAKNRQAKGYPLRMTYQQVLETIKIINHDIFIVLKEKDAIAAALIYHINNDVAQVIYWGDLPGFSEYKPINFLSYYLINYYSTKGYKYLDIGPSSEDSLPNYGLCDFKQSIGCDISTKVTFVK